MTTMFKTPSRTLRTLALPALLLSCGLAAAADNAAQLALGKKLFTTSTPACAICHTLKDAGAEGAVGPILDELQPDASRVAKVLRDGLGSMPSFKSSLSEAQILALSAYVAKASRGK